MTNSNQQKTDDREEALRLIKAEFLKQETELAIDADDEAKELVAKIEAEKVRRREQEAQRLARGLYFLDEAAKAIGEQRGLDAFRTEKLRDKMLKDAKRGKLIVRDLDTLLPVEIDESFSLARYVYRADVNAWLDSAKAGYRWEDNETLETIDAPIEEVIVASQHSKAACDTKFKAHASKPKSSPHLDGGKTGRLPLQEWLPYEGSHEGALMDDRIKLCNDYLDGKALYSCGQLRGVLTEEGWVLPAPREATEHEAMSGAGDMRAALIKMLQQGRAIYDEAARDLAWALESLNQGQVTLMFKPKAFRADRITPIIDEATEREYRARKMIIEGIHSLGVVPPEYVDSLIDALKAADHGRLKGLAAPFTGQITTSTGVNQPTDQKPMSEIVSLPESTSIQTTSSPTLESKDREQQLAALFDPVRWQQLESMFPSDGKWEKFAEKAKSNGLQAKAKVDRAKFNPYLAAIWWLDYAKPKGWDWSRCTRVLGNNLPARSDNLKHEITGDIG